MHIAPGVVVRDINLLFIVNLFQEIYMFLYIETPGRYQNPSTLSYSR